jgi:hypothetical protein
LLILAPVLNVVCVCRLSNLAESERSR